MKISYKNTALGFLDDPNFEFGLPKDLDKDLDPIERELLKKSINTDAVKDLAGGNIQFVSMSFWNAYAKYRSKLVDIFDKEIVEEGGTIITNGGSVTHTFFYYVKTFINGDGVWDFDLLFIDFSKHTQQDYPVMDVLIHMNGINSKSVLWKGHIDEGKDRMWWAGLVVTFVIFKKYCEVETKVVEGNRKAVHVGQKYKNETKQKITIIDSTWFTTLVRSEGFTVGEETGGFLALRYFGPGRTQKRLVWIEPFEKHGYTRKAKILSQNNQ